MPVSLTAALARGILCLFAAEAAAKKILSTCSCVYDAYIFCASLISARAFSRASTPSMIFLSVLFIPINLLVFFRKRFPPLLYGISVSLLIF